MSEINGVSLLIKFNEWEEELDSLTRPTTPIAGINLRLTGSLTISSGGVTSIDGRGDDDICSGSDQRRRGVVVVRGVNHGKNCNPI